MTPTEFRAVINEHGAAEIARRAGTTRRTIERARVKGAPPNGRNRDAVMAVILRLAPSDVDRFVRLPADEPPAAPQPDGLDDSPLYREERARKTRAERIRLDRINAVEAAELVRSEDVHGRVLAAAAALRSGHENARRNVEGVCCASCKGPAADTVDEIFAETARAVAEALRG